MKCTHCNSEWKVSPSLSKSLTKCPFCGAALRTESDRQHSLPDALKSIFDTYGAEVLLDNRMLLAVFADLEPDLKRERKLLQYFLEAGGNKAILDAVRQQRDTGIEVEKTVRHMTAELFVSQSAADAVCRAFLSAVSPVSEKPRKKTENTSAQNSAPTPKNAGGKTQRKLPKNPRSEAGKKTVGPGRSAALPKTKWRVPGLTELRMDVDHYRLTITKYLGQDAYIALPDQGLTSIGREAFKECDTLRGVMIPEVFTHVEKFAFVSCSLLEEAIIRGKLSEISWGMFAYCRELKHVELPGSLQKIGGEAFRNCVSLKQIEIPDSVTEIYPNAFMDCASIELKASRDWIAKNQSIIKGIRRFSKCSVTER